MTLSHLLYTNDASDCKQKAAGIHIYQNFYRSHIYQQHFHLLSMHQFFVFICFLFVFFVVVYFLWDSVCLESPYPDNDMIFMAFSRFAHDIDLPANREPIILMFSRCCTKFDTKKILSVVGNHLTFHQTFLQ